MPLIDAGGLSVHYQTLGEGRSVVMIHGLLVGSLAEWYFTAGPVLARRHRVVLYDLRGHGRTQRAAEGYDLATLSGDLDALVAAAGVEPPLDLAGHSYGGLVALRYALDHPDRVGKLALVDVPLPPSTMDELAHLDGNGLQRLLDSLPGPQQAAIKGGGRRGRRLLESLAFLSRDSTLLSDVAREQDIPDAELAKLTMPVLCLFGAGSRCLPVGERLARVVASARLVTLAGGHFLPLECPAELTAELERFLDG